MSSSEQRVAVSTALTPRKRVFLSLSQLWLAGCLISTAKGVEDQGCACALYFLWCACRNEGRTFTKIVSRTKNAKQFPKFVSHFLLLPSYPISRRSHLPLKSSFPPSPSSLVLAASSLSLQNRLIRRNPSAPKRSGFFSFGTRRRHSQLFFFFFLLGPLTFRRSLKRIYRAGVQVTPPLRNTKYIPSSLSLRPEAATERPTSAIRQQRGSQK
ncbi:hypothetical protein FA10DRAFT_29554 [Acaromyces ingoldii]|uniref:Uncharacterized protein n=1 Tax=Acaromyces ingoldii TaxID=215250 RepID=A0A316YYL5_9BASI|nr:hypothetical protein FA10DRAFT_29554 [Acaromyces ingoldii]PWN93728.1 hypothetical protein FA10DRAFT_29554 [Acaromyces ingoldii]